MYECKDVNLEKAFNDRGIDSNNLSGRVSFLAKTLGITFTGCPELIRRGAKTCQVNYKDLSSVPTDILSTMYGDLCEIYSKRKVK